MKIFERNNQYYESDGIEDICCQEFNIAYKEEDIIASMCDGIIFRAWDLYLEEYNIYKLKYCPFCGKKIR